MQGSRSRVPEWLLAAYVVIFVVSGWAPKDRFIWMTESALVLIGIPILVATYRRFPFADRTYVAMFVFLSLHAVGAHFGYTKVPIPWEDWGFARNHSDRVEHFLFGVLGAFPVREILDRRARIQGRWLDALTVVSTFALAAAFEIVEWLAVIVGGDQVGPQDGGYLGIQGDSFDPVKDMGLGLLGAAVTVAALAVLARLRRPAKARVAT